MAIDTKKLEDSFNSMIKNKPKEESVVEMSREEEVGFHKGSLNTLAAERNELVKMIGTVESIMQAHVKRLQELGVDLKKQ